MMLNIECTSTADPLQYNSSRAWPDIPSVSSYFDYTAKSTTIGKHAILINHICETKP